MPDGDAVVPIANLLAARFALAVATQDYHPPGHLSFASSHLGKRPSDVIDLDGLRQVLWPDHCVQGTHGAELHPALERTHITRVFQKGTDPRIDSYSGFFDNGRRKATGLAEYLKQRGATELYVVGLATDYCVKWTVLDGVRLGFRVHLVLDGCRAVEFAPGDAEKAVLEMRAAGTRVTSSFEVAPR